MLRCVFSLAKGLQDSIRRLNFDYDVKSDDDDGRDDEAAEDIKCMLSNHFCCLMLNDTRTNNVRIILILTLK